jgi:hypothetical protein
MQSAFIALKKNPGHGKNMGWWVETVMRMAPLGAMITGKMRNRDIFVEQFRKIGTKAVQYTPS